jgi:hypothetical protein
VLKTYKKIEYDKSMLGKNVTVITHESSKQRGFNVNKSYKGRLLDKVDWQVGCPVFECSAGKLGLGYECYIVEEIINIQE